MRKVFLFIILFLFLFCHASISFAVDKTDIEKRIQEYQAKLTELRQQKSSLSSEIQYMDTQIYLTSLRIQETEQKIENTQKEIELLTSKIEGLDTSLNYLVKQLLQRIVEGYKQHSVSFLDLFLNSNGAADLIDQVKYQKTAQENNQKILIQVQRTKLNFEEQKTLRETKMKELDELKAQLDSQKTELKNQQAQKQKLLADTQSSEVVYQSLLAQAQAQIAAFRSFVQSSGASSPIAPNGLGTGSDGNYYSQRDSRWAYQNIGNSSENIINVGCLLTSISMVLKKQGVDTNPSIIASNADYFSLNTAYMKYRWSINWPNGLRGYQISLSEVDNELKDHYVIVGVNYGGCGSYSDHFVVLTKKDGNEYKMHDPLYGPDLNFSSHYSQICWAETIK
jgi:peptidoglycan hydrolase CwlO-like protein